MSNGSARAQLAAYYERIPLDAVFAWLRNGERAHLREFAFCHTPRTPGGKVRFARYKFFESADELRAAMVAEVPARVEVGAIYEAPRDGGHSAAVAERELLFDIDMDAYDDVRPCACRGAALCAKCVCLGVECGLRLESALRTDFAFTRCQWVFSGRRGLHCWVSDAEARTMSNDARAGLVAYLRRHFNADGRLRLDEGVTCSASHLGKLPLCVHPATRRVCVPIADLGAFRLDDVPTLDAVTPDALAHYAAAMSAV